MITLRPGSVLAADDTPSDATVSVQASAGGLTRLNPEDGLFLRAEHLELIQNYARDLALVGAVAGGSGVVYGYQLSVDQDELQVSPGLAIDPGGAAARTAEVVRVSLASLDRSVAGRFWIVEVFAGTQEVLSGSEPLYGELCGDPCAQATVKPYAGYPARIQVRADDSLQHRLGGAVPLHARNALASAYFEQERAGSRPWLTPGPAGTVAPLEQLPWSAPQPGDPPAEPGSQGVPIGVLLRVEDAWLPDVWTARRDLMASPPTAAWQCRLSLRPWPVFLAQVLQFQAQLAQTPGITDLAAAESGDAEEFAQQLLELTRINKQTIREAMQQWRAEHRRPLVAGSLPGNGFDELPPAGFLPLPTGDGELADQVQAVFGPNVVIRIERNSADAALRAVTQGQHLDRIPLDQPDQKPTVDVWIPDHVADLPALRVPGYGWLAFVRGRDEIAAPTAPARDRVDVYIYDADRGQEPADVFQQFTQGRLRLGDQVASVDYPEAEWGVPTPEESVRAVGDALGNRQLIAVFGTANSDFRRPLAAARALLLAAGLEPQGAFEPVPTFAGDGDPEERIVLVTGLGQGR